MSSDPPRSKNTQQGFNAVFGNGRKRDTTHGNSGQRQAGDAPLNSKRPRPVDRPDERISAAQRDRVEASGPTPIVPQKARQPGNSNKSQSLDHLAIITANSLRPVLDSICERMSWFQARHKHEKSLERSRVIQEQSHYHPSDYPGSADLLVNQDKQIREDVENATQKIASADEKIATALQPLLQYILESSAKDCIPSRTSEERAVSDAKLAAVSVALTKEARDTIKQEASDVQQKIQELVELQMAKLKDAINQENEQKLEKKLNNKLRSLRLTLSEEAEARATSLRATLANEYEKRVAKMEEAVVQGHRKKVEELESALSEANQKNATLHEKMASLEARLDQSASEQRRLLNSLVDETQLSQKLQQLSVSKDEKLSKLEARLNSLPNHTRRLEQLEEDMREHSKLIEKKAQRQDTADSRLESLESAISEVLAEGKEPKEHVQTSCSSENPASPSNNARILEVIRPELDKRDEKTRTNINRIKSELRPFLEKERQSREALERQFEDISGQISELQSESSTAMTQLSGFNEDFDRQRQLIANGLKSLEDGVNCRLNLAISELKFGSRGTKPEFELSRDAYEGICMQLQALNSWQTHFSTKGLYRDIVTFIQNTLPESARLKIDLLEARLAAFENSMNHKRRKLPGSNATMVDGHQPPDSA